MTVAVDLPLEVAASLAHKAAQEGQDTASYLQHLAMREVQPAPLELSALRIPGLHVGLYWIADDFDTPLPDNYLADGGEVTCDGFGLTAR